MKYFEQMYDNEGNLIYERYLDGTEYYYGYDGHKLVYRDSERGREYYKDIDGLLTLIQN